jgi:leader peptidase (prepilin peptidase)/N-methyltransferase
MTAAIVAGCALFGLVIGSFLNVVIWRVPRQESVVRPASHCPGCENPIKPIDNIPVLSWLMLRGRCRHCSTRISIRYPLVELLTGIVFAALAARLGPHAALVAFLYLGAVGVALALIDLDTKRLPNQLVLPSYPIAAALLGVAALADGHLQPYVRMALGMVALFGFYFALAWVYPSGMGFGDVKLAGVLGLYLGWLGWGALTVGAFLGFLFGGVVGVALMLAGRAGRKSAIPFGPFMLAGAFVAVLWGQAIAHAYTHTTLG